VGLFTREDLPEALIGLLDPRTATVVLATVALLVIALLAVLLVRLGR